MVVRNNPKPCVAPMPTKRVGPVKINSAFASGDFFVPMTTFEQTLWPSTNRGSRVTRMAGGVNVQVMGGQMTRSVILEADSCKELQAFILDLKPRMPLLKEVVRQTSRFCEFLDMTHQVVGNLIYLRFAFDTGNAAGHNMTTKAADAILKVILQEYPYLRYVTISGNYCSDKKNAAVNGILGRGKYAVAEVVIPNKICKTHLRADPESIVALNIKKNLVGSIIAGGVRTANAHFANILLAVYLSTGQDAANIVEGSQGFVTAAVRHGDLYFSVTLPNLIVGTVGNGKDLPFVRDNLALLGCDTEGGNGAYKLAAIVAATVLCGELSLLAAQTNVGELTRSHMCYERKKQ